MKQEGFQSRFGLLAALIGMAVGTGNIWRFPRVLAENGGGAFLIPWFLFLFLWSVPLLLFEFSLGQNLRRGVTSCFSTLTGGRLAWMGCFVALCTLAIMFYYSVVTGWCLYYFVHAVSGRLFEMPSKALWESFTGSYEPLLFHAFSISLASFVILRGIRGGIETVSRILIPVLFVVLLVLALLALGLPGRSEGLGFVFNTDFSRLRDYRVWLDALTQSAWSTGAGWGLVVTYSCYADKTESAPRTAFTTGFGNNSIELLVAFAIFPTLFSFFPLPEVVSLAESGNTGLTFIALPNLFEQLEPGGGRMAAILFFMALFFAAFTSLFAMLELGVSFLNDLGIGRKKAIGFLALVALFAGGISALNMDFLDNQDWVWGVGLLVSGFFFSCLVRRMGLKRFEEALASFRHPFLKRCCWLLLAWLVPLEFLFLIGWWFYQAGTWDPQGWWHPLHGFSVGTCLLQWGVLIGVLVTLNSEISRRLNQRRYDG